MDIGSAVSKFGYSGDDQPECTFPSVLYDVDASTTKTHFVGEYPAFGEDIPFNSPLDGNVVKDWDGFEQLWVHGFNRLGKDLRGECIVFVEPYNNSMENRNRMTEILFEKFNVDSLYFGNPAVLSTNITGRISGIVIDSGHSYTVITPVYNNFPVTHAVKRLDISGKHLTEYLKTLLINNSRDIYPCDTLAIQDIKNRLCYVTQNDYREEMNLYWDVIEKGYEFPDERCISLTTERCTCPEALFQPQLLGIDSKGIPELILESINECCSDIRKLMRENIVLSGGSVTFQGFNQRLSNELTKASPNTNFKILHDEEINLCTASWSGASLISSVGIVDEMNFKKSDYQESGTSIIRKIWK